MVHVVRTIDAHVGGQPLRLVVEGALDAAINRFYLRRDGFAETGYVARQRDRVERRVQPPHQPAQP
jgi:hypothetical protein